jgi:microcompartment protein CcmL/EutN
MEALGMIETLGYVGTVEALDVALKAANVEFDGCELVGGGLVTVKVTGDVDAVNASIKAAEGAVRKVGTLISSFVIPKPDDQVFEVFCKDIEKTSSKESKNGSKQETISENEIEPVKGETLVSENEIERVKGETLVSENEIERVKGETLVSENETEPAKEETLVSENDRIKKQDNGEALSKTEEELEKIKEKLEKMKVVELRNLARQINLDSLTKKDIKFAKKEQLINAILDYYMRRLK